MVNLKDAVGSTIAFFRELMQDTISDIWLEEVELSDDEKFFLVTLSALAPTRKNSSVPSLKDVLSTFTTPPPEERLYRVFKVDTEKGMVKSMKIRPKP